MRHEVSPLGQDIIKRANARLDCISIMHRGKRLTLRGTLPPKPGDGHKPKQYYFSWATSNDRGTETSCTVRMRP